MLISFFSKKLKQFFFQNNFTMILEIPQDLSQSHENNSNIRYFVPQNIMTNEPKLSPSKEYPHKRQKKHKSSLINVKEMQKQAKKFTLQKDDPADKIDYLRSFCKQNRKQMYVKLFIRKLKQTIVRQEPFNHSLLKQEQGEQIYQREPFEMHLNIEITWSIIYILYLFVLFIHSTLSLSFDEVQKDKNTRYISYVCFLIQLIEILLKIFTKSSLKINKYREEQKYIVGQGEAYLKKGFIFDFIVLLILTLDCLGTLPWVKWCRIVLALKLIQVFEKIRYLEIVLIKNFYREQYWQLVKIFLINFFFAHILSVLLIIMAGLSPKQNWLTKNLLHNLCWPEKYIWSCYWAINIMLTVGFGDISATSTNEALCLIFIEMLSCILFTYNINSVGTILRNLTAYENEKQTNIKTFTRMQGKSNLSEQIKNKITNYINESSDMKRKYNIQEEEKLTLSLPEALNGSFLREVNQKLFYDLPFFRSISSKTLGELAVKMERKLAHPQQIILQCGKVPKIAIINEGTISLTISRPGMGSHGKEFQKQKIESCKKRLLSLYFLNNKVLQYDIKCSRYSEFYLLSNKQFQRIIREAPYNFQYYCMYKEKYTYFLGDFEAFECKACSQKQFHTLYKCPRFHYIPLGQVIIQRNLEQKKKQKKNKKLPNFKSFHRLKNTRRSNKQSAFSQFKNNFPQKISQMMKKVSSDSSSNKSSSSSSLSSQNELDKLSDSKASKFFENISNRSQSALSMGGLFLKIKKEIREEISKVPLLMNQCKVFQWETECDVAFDYQYYFPESNPSQLKRKSEKRIEEKKNKFKNKN